MTEEMDFDLIIGPLYGYEKIDYGIYYMWDKIIAVDHWTGEESVEFMTDILSHEFIHHLLKRDFSVATGLALDNFRRISEYEEALVDRDGEKAWNYLSPVAQFAFKCAALAIDEDILGNGII